MRSPGGRGALALACLAVLFVGACSRAAQPGAGATDAILAPAPSVTGTTGAAVTGTLGTLVVESHTPGPAAGGTTAWATATCPAGTTLVGGGASTLLQTGALPPSSLHVNGTFPAVPAPGTTATAWTTVGATGGQVVLGGETTGLSLCARLAVSSLQVVVASTPGPFKAASLTKATASCPAGTTLFDGGAQAGAPGSSPSLHLLGTFPSSADGAPLAPGASPSAWTAVADAGGRDGAGTTTVAYALCGTSVAAARTQVAVAAVAGPTAQATARTATATCPAGTSLLGGGVVTGLASGGEPQQGIHLTGSFPSSAAGAMVTTSGGTASWTGRAETGGQPAPRIQTTAFAVCAAG